ncbi:MAG: zinc ribbon domain-containing protein [Rhodanobacteraceae bacterium]
MNCPNCHQENVGGAHFCAQCGAAFSVAPAAVPTAVAPTPIPATTTPAAGTSGGNRTALIVLGVIFGVLLLFVVGIYTAFHMVANKVRALAGGDAQTTAQSQDASSNDAGTQQGAAVTGNVIGNVLGTDAKGKSDIGNALNNMTQAGAQIEQHDKATGNTNGTPDAADTQQAMGAAGGLLSALGHSLGGAHRHDPVDFHTLETLLPSSLPGMQRGTPLGNADQAMGIKATSAEVDFNGPNNARINVSIKDAAAMSGLAGLAEMANSNESEQGDNYEKNETIGGYSVHEKWDASSKHGELSLIVAKRYGVDVHGDNVDMDALKNALAQVDLGKLESMKDANPQAQ